MPSKENCYGLTPEALQSLLVETVKEILEPMVLFGAAGEDRKMSVYEHCLPEAQGSDEDNGFDFPPYTIVRMVGGNRSDADEAMEVDFYLLFCIVDTSKSRQGHKILLGVISRIENWFGERSSLGPFDINPDFEFVIQDADTHPYYYGAVKLSFGVPKTAKRSDLA